jgi:DNA-binding MarR family transcriptional regulator
MALAGDLSEFPLTDIIQLVDLSKQTGGVHIKGLRGAQQIEGWLYFRDGKIIGATLGSMPALEAAYTFFTVHTGPFQFVERIQPDSQTITQSNEVIIMEGIMYEEQWKELQKHAPAQNVIPRLVPNPAQSGSEISLEAEEWRVLTMVNGKNTVAQIAQRSGLGEGRTSEIIARLYASGLIEHREQTLAETLFPELERAVMMSLGASARALLYDSYGRSGIRDQSTATHAQVATSIDIFEALALRAFDSAHVNRVVHEMRELSQQAVPQA